MMMYLCAALTVWNGAMLCACVALYIRSRRLERELDDHARILGTILRERKIARYASYGKLRDHEPDYEAYAGKPANADLYVGSWERKS